MIGIALKTALVYLIIQFIDMRLFSLATCTRPLIIGAITGFVFGDFTTGMILGAELEAIFMGIMSIGGSAPSDYCVGTAVTVAYVIGTGISRDVALTLAVPIGTMSATFFSLRSLFLTPMQIWTEKAGREGNDRKYMMILCLFSILTDLIRAVVIFLCLSLGAAALENAIGVLPAWIMPGFSVATKMLPVVGFSILVSFLWSKQWGIFFFVGYALSKYLGLDTVAIVIFAAAIGITFFINDYRMMQLEKQKAGSGDKEMTEEEAFF